MFEEIRPYIKSIHTTAPGLILVGLALYELAHVKQITANAMVLITTGYGFIKSQTIQK